MTAPLPQAGAADARADSSESAAASMPGVLDRQAADDAWRALHRAAAAPYRQAGRFAWHFARGKLGRDPVFRGLLQHGHLPAAARVLDIGCGQSLLASLLQSCADLQAQGGWPAVWPVPASATTYTGIELMPGDVARARRAIGGLRLAPRLLQADMCEAALPPCDLAVILDVLHYVPHAAQEQVLQRVLDALRTGAASANDSRQARLLLRICDDTQRQRFLLTQWIDRFVIRVRGHRVPATWGRPLASWTTLLRQMGFNVQTQAMSQGTPFANVLLVCDVAA